jgi:hypothetical protein
MESFAAFFETLGGGGAGRGLGSVTHPLIDRIDIESQIDIKISDTIIRRRAARSSFFIECCVANCLEGGA